MKQLFDALSHPRDFRWNMLRPWRRHSLVLTLAGAAFIVIGWVYIITEPAHHRATSLEIATNIAPLDLWGVVFIIAGGLAMLSARWPPASEKWGYSVLASLASWWSGVYLAGVLLGAPNQSLSGSVSWALIAGLFWAISGLDNPQDHVCTEED